VTAAHGSPSKYVHDVVGRNSRLDAIQAVYLRAKLARLEKWNDLRREAALRYDDLLGAFNAVRLPRSAPANEDVWHLYVIRTAERDRVLDALAADGIGVGVHYPTPVHLTGAYQHLGRGPGSFPVTEAASRQILSLPMFPHLRADQQERVSVALGHALAVS
jgi:dTDP-4-amino-4,6-dideoxygalactose transaminase